MANERENAIDEQARLRRPEQADRICDETERHDSGSVSPLPQSLLSEPKLSGRGNAPVRSALVQRLQVGYGNRAVQRLMRDTVVRPQRQVEQPAGRVANRVVTNIQRDAGGAGAPPQPSVMKKVATIEEFIKFVETVEASYPTSDAKQVASEIRQIWFSGANWDVLVGSEGIVTGAGSDKEHANIEVDRPVALEYNMVDMRQKGSQKIIKTPMGEVSIGHVMAGIDAALSGAPASVPLQSTIEQGHISGDTSSVKELNLKYDTLMKASGKDPRDFATWSGDLGQAYAEYLVDRWVKKTASSTLASFVAGKASDEQLLGDIHGYIAKQVASEVPSAKGGTAKVGKVSDILRSLYMVSKKDVGAEQSYTHYFEEAAGKKGADLKPFIIERTIDFARPWFAKTAFDAGGSWAGAKWWHGEGWTAETILDNYMKDFGKYHAQNESSAAAADKIGEAVDKFLKMVGQTMP